MAFDDQSNRCLETLYPDVKTRAICFQQDVLKVLSLQIKITEALRTFEKQTALYTKGRQFINGLFQVIDRKQVVTNAKAGESIHQYGLAFDIAFQGPDPYLSKYPPAIFDATWRKVGIIGQQNGFKWGYDWNGNGLVDGNDFDRPHFEMTYNERVSDLRELYKINGLSSVWARIDQRRGVPQNQDWNDLTIKNLLSSLES